MSAHDVRITLQLNQMPNIYPTEYPLSRGHWTCSECGKGKLRAAYPCEVCFAVLCESCVEGQHERPIEGYTCGESRDVFEQLESD